MLIVGSRYASCERSHDTHPPAHVHYILTLLHMRTIYYFMCPSMHVHVHHPWSVAGHNQSESYLSTRVRPLDGVRPSISSLSSRLGFEPFTASGDSRCCRQHCSTVFKLTSSCPPLLPPPPHVHLMSLIWYILRGLPRLPPLFLFHVLLSIQTEKQKTG